MLAYHFPASLRSVRTPGIRRSERALLGQRRQSGEGMCDGNADSESADLSAGWRVELDGAADVGCRRVFVGYQCKCQVPVGGERQGIGCDLRAGIVANHDRHAPVDRLPTTAVYRDSRL